MDAPKLTSGGDTMGGWDGIVDGLWLATSSPGKQKRPRLTPVIGRMAHSDNQAHQTGAPDVRTTALSCQA